MRVPKFRLVKSHGWKCKKCETNATVGIYKYEVNGDSPEYRLRRIVCKHNEENPFSWPEGKTTRDLKEIKEAIVDAGYFNIGNKFSCDVCLPDHWVQKVSWIARDWKRCWCSCHGDPESPYLEYWCKKCERPYEIQKPTKIRQFYFQSGHIKSCPNYQLAFIKSPKGTEYLNATVERKLIKDFKMVTGQ